MASQRKLIRAQIVSVLKAGSTLAGQNVFPNRWLPTWETELPAIFVYTGDEPCEVFVDAPRELERRTQIVVELIVAGDSSLDDTLDDLADVVEDLIAVDAQLAETAADAVLKGSELEMFSNGDALMGSLKLTWEVTWYKRFPKDQSATLAAFKTGDLKITSDTDTTKVLIEGTVTVPGP
jgi:hypothetical protein